MSSRFCRRQRSSMGLTIERPPGWSLRCNGELGTITVHRPGEAGAQAPRIHFSTMRIDADSPLEGAVGERLVRWLGPAGASAGIETEAHPPGGERLRLTTRYERGSPMVRWGLIWRGSERRNEALYADVHWPENAPEEIPSALQTILDSVEFRGGTR